MSGTFPINLKTVVRKIFTRNVHEREMKKKYFSAYEDQHTASHFYLVKHLKVFNLSILFGTPLMTFQNLWLSGEVPSDWTKGNFTPIFKMRRNEEPGNY